MQFTQGADEYEEGEDYFDLYITGTQVEDGPYLEEEHDSTGERNESTSIARVEPNYEDMLIVEEKEEDEEVQPVPQQASPLVNQAEELDNEAVESSKLDELLLDSDEEAMQSQVDGEVAESYSPEYMSLQVSQTENQHEEALSSNNENDNNEDNDNNIDADKGMNSSDIIPAVESSTLHLSKKSVSFHQEEEEEEEVGEGEEEEEDEMEVEVSQTQVQEEEGDGDITNPTVTDEISRSNFISSPIIQMNKQSTPVVDKEEELANNDINSEDDHGDGEPSGEDDFDVQVSQTQANVEPVISGHHQFHQNEQAPEEQDEIKAEEDSDDFEIHVSQTQLPEEGVVLGKDSTDSSRQVSPVIVQVAAERSPENFSIYDIAPSSPGIPTATTTTTPKQKANNTSRRFEESPTQIDTYYRSPELATNRKLAQPHINPVESSNTAVTGKISVNPTIRPTEESSIEWLNSRRVFNEVGLPSTSLVDNKKGQIKQYEEILDDMELHLSQSVDRSAEDLAILQDEYARKLQELLAMKKTIESASKSKNSLSVPSSVAKEAKPGASSNKEHDNVSFGFGTLECANILIDINKSIEDTSNNVASSPLMVDVSSPARFPDIVGLKSSDGISANNTSSAPSRKFNTSFAALPSSSKVTPNEPKDNIPNTSGERLSSGKFRRRYAATNNLSPDPTAKSAVIDLSASEKLFEFPGAEEEEVDLSSTTNKKQEVQLKRDNIKNFANDAVSDEDEEFDEHQTKATSSVQKDSIIALSTNQKAVKIMNINKDEALLKHLSAQLLHNGLPQKWAKLWSQLESVGWYWTKGKGLISFYYIRPNAKGANPYVMNRDYFPSGEDVVKYLKQFVYEEHEVAKQQASLQVTSLSSSSSKKVTIAVNKDGDEQDSSMSSSSSALLKKQRLIKPMKRVIDDDAGWNDEDDARLLAEHHGKGKQQPQQSKPDESHKASTSAFSSPASVMDDNGAMDIRSIPWKDLWKILRGLGWSWDFGPSHLNYYYRPGYDSKKDKEAILGEHKFENDDSIRRYIRKQIKNGNAREWSMFFVSNLHRNDSIQESQQAEAHIRDPSWTLTTHRKRRESHNQSHVTDALDDHLDDGDDSASDDFASHKPNKRLSNNNSKASSVKSNKRKSVAEHQSKSTKRYSNNDYEEMTQAQDLTPPQTTSLSRKSTTVPSSLNLPSSPVVSRYSKDNSLMNIVHSTLKQKRDSLITTDVSSSSNKRGGESNRANNSASSQHRAAGSSGSTLLVSSSSTSKGNSSSGQLLKGWSLVFSGIEEKLRNKLESDVKKQGGKVLNEIPKDDHVYDEHLVLISQPKDFRKLKYLFALLVGVKILHAQWLLDSLDSGVLQADYSYQLPATYSALHSCYIFKSNSHLTPARSVGVGKKKEEEPFLSNLQVLNLTGMKIWDDVLLASGAMIVNRDEYYLQGILKNAAFGINNNETNFADLILFDPVVYARSYILSYGNSKFANQQNQSSRNTARAGKEKKSVPTISELEIRVLKHFSELQSRSDRKANSGPIVASIDWLTHVISLKEFVDVNSLDLFALPTDPVRYPTAFKADFEFDPTLKDVSGERYSKYDLVYFAQNMPGTNSSSSEPLSIGKIIGFSRRNEDNAPMVRVQTVDIEQEVRPLKHNRMLTIQQLTPVLNPITESTVEILVSTQQLTGKVVLLHRTGYVEVTGYTGNAKSASDASVHNSDKVFSTSLMLEDHWPLVPWNNNLYQQHDENSDKSDADDYGFHPSKKRKVNMRSSQDY